MRLGWENILRGSAGRFSQNDTFINIFGKYVSFTPNLPTSYVFGLFSQPSLVHYPVTGQKKTCHIRFRIIMASIIII